MLSPALGGKDQSVFFQPGSSGAHIPRKKEPIRKSGCKTRADHVYSYYQEIRMQIGGKSRFSAPARYVMVIRGGGFPMTIAQQATDRVQQIRPIQFIAVGKQTRVPAPLVRVTTCGLLTLETVQELVSTDPPLARYASLTPEQQRGRGTARHCSCSNCYSADHSAMPRATGSWSNSARTANCFPLHASIILPGSYASSSVLQTTPSYAPTWWRMCRTPPAAAMAIK